jgi:hypothetical protein
MDESTTRMNGREHDPTTRDTTGGEPPTGGEPAEGQAPGGPGNPSPPAAPETKTRGRNNARARRIVPWVIAAVAVLVAAIAIGVLVVNESSEPRPVARLTPQTDTQGSIPVDEEAAGTFEIYGVTEADFVSHGSYGALEAWSTTKGAESRCLALVIENHISVLNCTAPTLDTIADFNIDPQLVPPAPSGEPTSTIRFVSHDDVVDVYLAPNPEGGFY